jgi:hypothetical protein
VLEFTVSWVGNGPGCWFENTDAKDALLVFTELPMVVSLLREWNDVCSDSAVRAELRRLCTEAGFGATKISSAPGKTALATCSMGFGRLVGVLPISTSATLLDWWVVLSIE